MSERVLDSIDGIEITTMFFDTGAASVDIRFPTQSTPTPTPTHAATPTRVATPTPVVPNAGCVESNISSTLARLAAITASQIQNFTAALPRPQGAKLMRDFHNQTILSTLPSISRVCPNSARCVRTDLQATLQSYEDSSRSLELILQHRRAKRRYVIKLRALHIENMQVLSLIPRFQSECH